MNTDGKQLDEKDFEALNAWIDGELTGHAAEDVERHLNTDPAWQEASAQLREVDKSLDALSAPSVPADLCDNVMQFVVSSDRRWAGLTVRMVKWFGGAAAAALVIFSVWYFQFVNNKPTEGNTPITPAMNSEISATAKRIARENPQFFHDYGIIANLEFLADSAEPAYTPHEPTTITTVEAAEKTVSVERQLRLKMNLRAIAEGSSLEETISKNEKEWQNLPDDRKQQYHQKAVAFLKSDPKTQQKILRKYDRMLEMQPREIDKLRNKLAWITIILDTFTPQEKTDLLKIPPAQREKIILKRKSELVRDGKLTRERD